MKICISGSMTLIEEMEALARDLTALKHQVSTPTRGENPEILNAIENLEPTDIKAFFVREHLEKIRSADVVLIANFQKDNIPGYIGQSTLLEAAMAFALNKKVYLLNTPSSSSMNDDLKSMNVIYLEGDIGKI